MVTLICEACGKTFQRELKYHNRRVRNGSKHFYCSQYCVPNTYPKQPHPCLFCGKDTLNPKFCSRSCSASRRIGKKSNPPKPRCCKQCGATFFMYGTHRSASYCPECKNLSSVELLTINRVRSRHGNKQFLIPNYKSITLEQAKNGPYLKGKHKSQITIYVRLFNRSWNKEKLSLPCAYCGYSKHVELAHIKPVSSFSPDSTLGEINSPSNVVQLCPNHHWELDHGLLDIDKIWEGRSESDRNLHRS